MWNKRKVSTSVPTRTFVTSHGHTANSMRVPRLRESINRVISFSSGYGSRTQACPVGEFPLSLLYHNLPLLSMGT